jgi:hypothetical protein
MSRTSGYGPTVATVQPPSGHVFRVERRRGAVWYAKYRLPDGRQVQKKIGPAWSERGRPPAGYYTRRQAEDWLRDVLHDARRGTLPGMVRSGVTFADAASEWLRFIREDRERKPSTLVDYESALRAHLLPAFGDHELEAITPDEIERWRRSLTGLANRSKNKLLIQLHGISRRAQTVWALAANPLARVEKHPMRPSGDIPVFSPEEVRAPVRAAASDQDGALFLTAAFTGLRLGQLIALCCLTPGARACRRAAGCHSARRGRSCARGRAHRAAAHIELHHVRSRPRPPRSNDASVLPRASALTPPCPIRWKPSHAIAHTVPGRAGTRDGHRAIARNSCSIVG